MDYRTIKPSFELKEFRLMTHKDAQIYFEWFIKLLPERINRLRAACERAGAGELDYSKQSLIALWRWFSLSVKKDDPHRLTIALDIGVYFAECLVRAHRSLKWSYMCSPKRLAYVNKPIVSGFVSRIGLDTESLLIGLSKEAEEDGADERDDSLLRAFEDWADRVSSANECIA